MVVSMYRVLPPSPSLPWACLTASAQCPFLSSDPRLFYYGATLLTVYLIFFVIFYTDLNFWWSLDQMQKRIEGNVLSSIKRLSKIEADQSKQCGVKQRALRQMKRSGKCNEVVNSLRTALNEDMLRGLVTTIKEQVCDEEYKPDSNTGASDVTFTTSSKF